MKAVIDQPKLMKLLLKIMLICKVKKNKLNLPYKVAIAPKVFNYPP